jgi:hypothetical protein
MNCWSCKKEKPVNPFSILICEDCIDEYNKIRGKGK